MHRTPPGDDEQDELAEYGQETGAIEGTEEELEASETYSARISRIPRRRSGPLATRSLEYSEDAFPHRPKVLRASRLLAQQEIQRQEERAAPVEEELERTTGRRMRATPVSNPDTRQVSQGRQRRPYRAPRVEDTEEDTDTEEPLYTPPPRSARQRPPSIQQPRSTQRLMVIPPGHARVRPAGRPSPPPPPAHPHRERRRGEPSLLTYFQEWPYRKPALAIVGIVAVLLILVPVLIGVVSLSNRSNVVINGAQPGTQQGQGPTAPPANPHELVIIPSDTDHPPPPVFATSAYLLDADTGVTLYAHNPFMHLPMLSTTKLMTAIIAVQKGNLNQSITITPAIWHDIQQLSADSSLFGIKQG